MSFVTAVSLKVVLDTNVIVSAVGYGGKPGKVLLMALAGKIHAVTSEVLLAEIQEILTKKLTLPLRDVDLTVQEIKNKFILVKPQNTLNILKDEDDNRVLEAAVEGGCNVIVTGVKELLALGKFRGIKIVSADQFLNSA